MTKLWSRMKVRAALAVFFVASCGGGCNGALDEARSLARPELETGLVSLINRLVTEAVNAVNFDEIANTSTTDPTTDTTTDESSQ